MAVDRERLKKEFGHLDIFEDAMKVIEGIEDDTIKPRVVDYTGEFPKLKQGKLVKAEDF
jgi:hypothetical protein